MEQSFWDDAKSSNVVLKKITQIKNKIENFNKIKQEIDDIIEFNNFLNEEQEYSDEEAEEVLKNTSIVEKKIERLEIDTLLSGKI